MAGPDPHDGASVFQRCPRCDYSLRGLDRDHACPECGLRLDDRSLVFRVRNPRQLFLVWVAILGSGWISLKHLGDVAKG